MAYRALVIGATGLVGSALVKRLLNECDCVQVISLSRRKLTLTHDKLVQHQVEFDKLVGYRELFSADVMFSCLGTTKKQAGSIAAQRRVDFDYQLQAAELAKSMGVQHLLLVSSSGANKLSKNKYLQMKGELESEVKKLDFAQLTIVQPSLLLGKRAEFRFGELVGAYLLPLICRLPFLQDYRPIQGDEVATRLVQLAQRQDDGVKCVRLQEVFPIEDDRVKVKE